MSTAADAMTRINTMANNLDRYGIRLVSYRLVENGHEYGWSRVRPALESDKRAVDDSPSPIFRRGFL